VHLAVHLPNCRAGNAEVTVTAVTSFPFARSETRPELSRKGFGRRIIVPIMPILKRDGARWGSPDTFAALHL
jgi:hypothetical protein